MAKTLWNNKIRMMYGPNFWISWDENGGIGEGKYTCINTNWFHSDGGLTFNHITAQKSVICIVMWWHIWHGMANHSNVHYIRMPTQNAYANAHGLVISQTFTLYVFALYEKKKCTTNSWFLSAQQTWSFGTTDNEMFKFNCSPVRMENGQKQVKTNCMHTTC